MPSQMLRGAFLFRSALALVLTGMFSAPLYAQQNLNWDANGTGIGNGGTGIWNTAALVWSPNADGVSGPYSAWINANLDNAIFGGTAGTVTLGAPISVGNLTFGVGGYTIAGTGANTLTLGGATPTITANAGTTTISAVFANTAGLTKAGAAAVTVSSNSTFTGGITVNAGTLTLSGSNSIGGGLTVNGGLLNVSGTNSLSGGITVAAGLRGTPRA